MGTVADALLEALDEQGVEYFIGGGAGTDFPPLVEAFARRQSQGSGGIRPLTIVHEITAVAMAHGYAMVSGKTPFVMLHTSVGTANGVGGVINAARSRTPMVLAAGRSPITEQGHRGSRTIVIHWAQEAFDQAGMLREFVKWDYELRMGSQTALVVDRAFGIAASGPRGPVYLALPLEVLSADFHGEIGASTQRPDADRRPAARAVEEVAERMRAADNPIIVTSSLGRDPAAVPVLVDLAERLGAGVFEQSPTYMNFPRAHPLHAGFDPSAAVPDSDLVIVVESGIPWYPNRAAPAPGAVVVQIDEAPLYPDYPIRGFPTTLNLPGTPIRVLEDLLDALGPVPASTARREAWAAASERARAARGYDAARAPIDPAWISHCVGQVVEPEDIVVNEYVLNPADVAHLGPGHYFNHSHAGGLGWGINAALGAKLARPGSTVVCCIGDGAYTFGAPVSTHHASAMHNLPVLFVVFNNSMLNATRRAALAANPQGWVQAAEALPFCSLEPSPRYDQVCAAAGGYGVYVTEPQALPEALGAARQAVRAGRQALVNVACSV